MLKNLFRFISILLIISIVELTQNDYEYNTFDERDDYSDYQPMPHRSHRFYNKRRQTYRATQFSTLDEQEQMPKKRGVVGNVVGKASKIVNGVLGLGKCLIRCVLTWYKSCDGLLSCPWNCLFPNRPLPQINKKQDDNDISVEIDNDTIVHKDASSQTKNRKSVLSPNEIVAVVRCFTLCLVRYLPRNPISLTQMLTCVVMRCLCGTSNNKNPE